MTSEPSQLIRAARCLLLDFDGPVCDLYAGHPATTVADRLRDLITSSGTPIPEHIAQASDPLEIFSWTGTVSPALAFQVEAEMSAQEVAAVATARPAPYVHDLMTSARQSGRAIAIVSNNSEQAVGAYLTRHSLQEHISAIAARTSPDPALLKPGPHLLNQAIAQLGTEAANCVMIGDQPTDIHAAAAAGTPVIGYASRPGRQAELADAGATTIIRSLSDLVLPLRAQPLPN